MPSPRIRPGGWEFSENHSGIGIGRSFLVHLPLNISANQVKLTIGFLACDIPAERICYAMSLPGLHARKRLHPLIERCANNQANIRRLRSAIS